MRRARRTLPALLLALLVGGAPLLAQDGAERARALFGRIDAILESLEGIMGLKALAPIERQVLSREQINALISERIAEETSEEDIRREEMYLRLMGFVDDRFDLAEQVVDVMTEQAAALYDYKTKTMYLSDWASADMQEFALVHELAHALADQHFDLGKFVEASGSADGDLARSAAIEGQASWVMTEWLFQQSGRSLIGNRLIALAAASASKVEAQDYPVYSGAPLYIRETLMFPYSEGLLFQQELMDKYGRDGIRKIFEKPPASSRHILDPASYFDGAEADPPDLPPLRLKGWRRTSEGDSGRLDHAILLKQYFDEKTADRVAPAWRGAHYEIWEPEEGDGAVLRYASTWATDDDARLFFDLYRKIYERKRPGFVAVTKTRDLSIARNDCGGAILSLTGPTVRVLEGLPGNISKLKSQAARTKKR